MHPKIRLLPFFTMPSAIWSDVVALIHPATDLGVVVASTEVAEAGLPAAGSSPQALTKSRAVRVETPSGSFVDASVLGLPWAQGGLFHGVEVSRRSVS
jgi:hypothetical protein